MSDRTLSAETRVRSPGFCRQCRQHYEFEPHVCQPSAEPLTVADYEEVQNQHRKLVRELDVLLNGDAGAARQASLCDIVAQLAREHRNRPSNPVADHERRCLAAFDKWWATVKTIPPANRNRAISPIASFEAGWIARGADETPLTLSPDGTQVGRWKQGWPDETPAAPKSPIDRIFEDISAVFGSEAPSKEEIEEALQEAARDSDPRSDDDPTRWCDACGAMRQADCHCVPIADNE